jgi:hypothetical protein
MPLFQYLEISRASIQSEVIKDLANQTKKAIFKWIVLSANELWMQPVQLLF